MPFVLTAQYYDAVLMLRLLGKFKLWGDSWVEWVPRTTKRAEIIDKLHALMIE